MSDQSLIRISLALVLWRNLKSFGKCLVPLICLCILKFFSFSLMPITSSQTHSQYSFTISGYLCASRWRVPSHWSSHLFDLIANELLSPVPNYTSVWHHHSFLSLSLSLSLPLLRVSIWEANEKQYTPQLFERECSVIFFHSGIGIGLTTFFRFFNGSKYFNKIRTATW